jgi:hypothetical protein
VTLSKIGSVKMVSHRPMKGKVKTCTVQRSSIGTVKESSANNTLREDTLT